MKKVQELFDMSREVSKKYPDAKDFAVLCTEDFISQLREGEPESGWHEIKCTRPTLGGVACSVEVISINKRNLFLFPIKAKYIGHTPLITILE